MIVTCTNCSTRLQLEDAKVPARPFTVRCPKCQQIINAQPPQAEGPKGGALSVAGDLPSSSRTQREMSAPPAQVFSPDPAPAGAEQTGGAAQTSADGELARLLAALLRRGGSAGETSHGVPRRPEWEPRRALVCLGPPQRELAARSLAAAGGYEVFVAETTTQAVERMREDKMDVVVLDQEFDPMEQGAAFITREIGAMRPAERRRVVFAQLSPTARTGDAHAAFLANVNLVVNTGDAAGLPAVLDKTIHDLNELYRHFNKALSEPEI